MITNIHYKLWILTICIFGVILHGAMLLHIASFHPNDFMLIIIIFNLSPYLLIIALYRLKFGGMLSAIVVFLLNNIIYINTLYFPKSSTASLAIIFTPLLNIIFIVPTCLLIAYIIKKIKAP